MQRSGSICCADACLSTPINTVNRQCSSGLTAVAQIANEIKSGEIDIGIGELVTHYSDTCQALIVLQVLESST